MLCAICRQPSRGFGWFRPPPAKLAMPTHWFCSLAHLDAWSRHWKEFGEMMDMQPHEANAIRATIKPLAEHIGAALGFDRRFDDLSAEEIETLIQVVVGNYHEALAKLSSECPFDV